MVVVDPLNYTLIPYVIYGTVEEKLQALLNGEVLYMKEFEKKSGGDVLIRLEKKKFTLTQISYDLSESESDPRYWVTFNIGLNDLSLFTAIRFEEGLPVHGHKYEINDIVNYESADGAKDTAVVEAVYVSNLDPNQYAYRLSRDTELYAEEDLVEHKYM
jgi:hypothetical protein